MLVYISMGGFPARSWAYARLVRMLAACCPMQRKEGSVSQWPRLAAPEPLLCSDIYVATKWPLSHSVVDRVSTEFRENEQRVQKFTVAKKNHVCKIL